MGGRASESRSMGRREGNQPMTVKIILAHTNGSLAGRELELTRPGQYVLGRSGDGDVQLPNTLEFGKVSRHHCALDVSPPVVRVRDLDSRNGTFINGQNIGRPHTCSSGSGEVAWHTLNEGDTLRLAGTDLRVGIIGGSRRPGEADSP